MAARMPDNHDDQDFDERFKAVFTMVQA